MIAIMFRTPSCNSYKGEDRHRRNSTRATPPSFATISRSSAKGSRAPAPENTRIAARIPARVTDERAADVVFRRRRRPRRADVGSASAA
jgi:hypothetical protein